jgi:hypothetical protein
MKIFLTTNIIVCIFLSGMIFPDRGESAAVKERFFPVSREQDQTVFHDTGTPFSPGETITYVIKKLRLTVGEAKLVFNGPTSLNGQEVILVTFIATSMNFRDEEKIYLHPQTFYPVVVERDLNIWGKKEKIREEYLPQQSMVKVTKTAGGKTTEQSIKKAGVPDNIYGFIYRYRLKGNFRPNEKFKINLPTKTAEVQIEKKTTLKAAGKRFESYLLNSKGGEYRVWFDAGPKKIPLRIDGAIKLGNAAMVMEEYSYGTP